LILRVPQDKADGAAGSKMPLNFQQHQAAAAAEIGARTCRSARAAAEPIDGGVE
jgi:hypothetical protein